LRALILPRQAFAKLNRGDNESSRLLRIGRGLNAGPLVANDKQSPVLAWKADLLARCSGCCFGRA